MKETEQIFNREVTQNKWIEEHVAPGQQIGQYFITGEYSYHSKHCAAEGLLLAGDAFCFLDPVFSSGLMLALKSGVMAGDAVHEALLAHDFSPTRFAEYGRQLREGIENMRKLVYAFYDQNFSFRQLTDKYPDLAGDVTDCLSGDVNKDFSRLFNAVAEFAPVPEPLAYGAPLVKGGKKLRGAHRAGSQRSQSGCVNTRPARTIRIPIQKSPNSLQAYSGRESFHSNHAG